MLIKNSEKTALIEPLKKVKGSDENFIEGIVHFTRTDKKMQLMIEYLEENDDINTDDVYEYLASLPDDEDEIEYKKQRDERLWREWNKLQENKK